MERPEQSSTSKRVVWVLLGYLYAHPDAKDTAEGIADWWLRGCGVTANGEDVKEALNELVIRDWLTVTGSPSRHKIYSLNPVRKMELQQLLDPNR